MAAFDEGRTFIQRNPDFEMEVPAIDKAASKAAGRQAPPRGD
jgi:hypothetical protein